MTWLFESPYPALFVGALGLAVLGIMLAQTQRVVYAFAMGGVVAVVCLLLVVELVVVTEREEVEAALDSMARALESNSVPAVLSHISESADGQGLRSQAEGGLSMYNVHKAKIRDLEISVQHASETATAEFDGTLTGNPKIPGFGGGDAGQPYLQRFILRYRREGPNRRWLVYRAEQHSAVGQPESPIEGMMK